MQRDPFVLTNPPSSSVLSPGVAETRDDGRDRELLTDLAAGRPVGDKLTQMRIAGVRARDMVAKLLAFARRQPVRLVPCQVQPLVHETLALLRATLPAGARLVSELPDEPVYAEAREIFEKVALHEVFVEFLTLTAYAQLLRDGS